MNVFTHEQLFRGKDLLERISSCSIFFCGAGAIGSNMVDNMVRQGFKKISVADFDRVDVHNISTQFYDRRDAGQLKVNALKNRVFGLIGVEIEAIPKKVEQSNVEKILGKSQIIVDAFDNSESRRLVTDYCLKNNRVCLHVGMYQYYAEIVWNQFYRVPNPVKGMDVCEYPLARNTVMMAVTIATEVIIRYLDKGAFENYAMTLGDFKIERI